MYNHHLSLFALGIAGSIIQRSLALPNIGHKRANSDSIGNNCIQFGLKGSTLSAGCSSAKGVLAPASLDLNQCVTNDLGNLKFGG